MPEPSQLVLTPFISLAAPGYPSRSALQLQLRPKWQRFYRRNSATSSGSYFPQSHLTPELQTLQEKGAQTFASLILGPLPWLGIGAHARGSHKPRDKQPQRLTAAKSETSYS